MLGLLGAGVSTSQAHPVTFENGLAVAAVFQNQSVLIESGYTLSRHIALGSTYLRSESETGTLHGGFGHLNLLAYRYNGHGSQGNVYLNLGGGGGTLGKADPGGLGYSAVQLDFETLNFYTALMSKVISDFDKVEHQTTYRIGFAPYVAPYKSLQTWLVAQTTYVPRMEEPWNGMLLLRFFYNTVLWELGGDIKGRPWIHIMVHH